MNEEELKVEIKNYCSLNKIDYNSFLFEILKIGFNIKKYGIKPMENIKNESSEIKIDNIKKDIYDDE